MKELIRTCRNISRYVFEIMAAFAVGYTLILLTLVLIEFEAKLNIADRVVYYLRFIPWGAR